MGLIDKIGGFFGKIADRIFGDSKEVEVAKIQQETQLRLADKEFERAEMEQSMQFQIANREIDRAEIMRDAQLEIIRAQTMSQVAVEKARAEGMKDLATHLVSLQEKMLQIAEQRLKIIEKASLPIIREIETFYNEIGEKIQADSDAYNTEKLPKLLQILNQYEKDSPAHQLYFAQIQNDMARQGVFIEQQLQQVSERQNLVLQSFLASKEKILDQTAQITETLAQKLLTEKIQTLPPSQEVKALPFQEIKSLSAAN